jgi:hypothetical protein
VSLKEFATKPFLEQVRANLMQLSMAVAWNERISSRLEAIDTAFKHQIDTLGYCEKKGERGWPRILLSLTHIDDQGVTKLLDGMVKRRERHPNLSRDFLPFSLEIAGRHFSGAAQLLFDTDFARQLP